jgi:hypothetical protein
VADSQKRFIFAGKAAAETPRKIPRWWDIDGKKGQLLVDTIDEPTKFRRKASGDFDNRALHMLLEINYRLSSGREGDYSVNPVFHTSGELSRPGICR